MGTNLAALPRHHEPALSAVALAESVSHAPPRNTLEEQIHIVRVPSGTVPPDHISRFRYLERQGFYKILCVCRDPANPHVGHNCFEVVRRELVGGTVGDRTYHFLFD